jgi:hypothetical protein
MIGKINKSNKSFTKINYNWLVRAIIIISIVIFAFSSVFWWREVRNNPENLFNAMLNNNLRTASVTRTVTQDNGSQKLEQVMRIQNRTQHITNGTTTITQDNGSTIIVTESIGQPNVEFIRYKKIDTNQKGTKGNSLDFGEVLNTWGENKPESNDQLSELYQDVTIGNLFMFADLDKQDRQTMLNQIKDNNVYEVDYNDVKRTSLDGRNKVSYKVKLNPKQYISMVKEYGKMVGLTQFESLNPDDYSDSQPITFAVTIDVLSQRVEATRSADGANEQTFNGYGIIENIELPKNYIPSTELQKRLTEKASA